METVKQFDVCIIGAGVAGGIMAAYLGKHGLRVAVVEKNMAEQERMIGELLQPGGVIKLRELGLEHLLDELDAQQIEGYGLFMNGDSFKIAYPQQNGQTITGRGLRNGKFVQRIRQHILSIPNITVVEGAVNELMEYNGRVTGVKYTDRSSSEECDITASLTIVCDGMFSAFRGQLSAGEKKVSSYFLGMILKDCQLPFKNHGHVIIAKPSPCLIYPISSDETRILIDFPGSEAPRKSAELTTYLSEVIAPQLPVEILPSFMQAITEARFKVMPNHLVPAKPFNKAGVAMIGDSLNMRHPLTGGGMTAAFSDILNLGSRLSVLKDFDKHELVDGAVKDFYASRHKQNATINILADALYGVMQNEDLKTACYSYLKSGGNRALQPVSILSAVSRNEQLLLRHFFAVALHGIGTHLKPFPTPAKVGRSFRLLQNAVHIVKPLVMNEHPNLITRSVFRMAGVLF